MRKRAEIDAPSRRTGFLAACARCARPALMCQRHREDHVEPFRPELLLGMTIKLAFDHHRDQPRAESRRPHALWCGTSAFLPFKDQSEALLGAGDRPRQIHAARRTDETPVLAGIGEKLMYRHAQAKRGIRLEEHV